MLTPLAHCILKIEYGIKTTAHPADRAIGEKLLSALAPILAAAVAHTITPRQLDEFERLHSHLFLLDEASFGSFYQDWQAFRQECDPLFPFQMSLFERLFNLDLMDQFRDITNREDWPALRLLLQRLNLDEETINDLLKEF